MADTFLEDLPLGAIALTDYVPFSSDPTGTAVSKNITLQDFSTAVFTATAAVNALAAKQPIDATLTAFAALTIAANTITIGTEADAFSQTAFAANTFPARASTGDLVAKTITDFGLSLVDDADAAAGLLTLGAAPLASPTFTGTPAAPTAAGGTSTTQLATTAFVTSAISTAVSGLLDLKGSLDCSTNPNYPAASQGDAYYVSVAGKIGGASGESVDVGDTIIASADNAGGTEAAVGTSWFVIEHNLAGALLAANNLSDLTNAVTARTNLGLTANGSSLVTAADYAAMRGLLDLEAGTDFYSITATDAAFQPKDATLTALAGLTIAANTLTIGTGADAFAQTSFSANTFPARASTGDFVAKSITDFGLSLLDDAAAVNGRATLGLIIGTDVAAQSSLANYLPLAGGIVSGSIVGATGVGIRTSSPTFALDVGNGAGSYLDAFRVGYAMIGGHSGTEYDSLGYNTRPTSSSTVYNYAISDFACRIMFHGGGFRFYTAPSGTAGNAITETERLTILQGGNVGIGDASPDEKLTVASGNICVATAGYGITIKEGSNARMGISTLVGGTVTVSTTAVTANSRIVLTGQNLGTITVPVGYAVSARNAGADFTILSANALDTSDVMWQIFEPA